VSSERDTMKSIFDEAADIASPQDRAASLERACGGDAGCCVANRPDWFSLR
jgi:hypothetical protein